MRRESKALSTLTLLVAATAAIGTVVQAWYTASQELPIPQIQADSIGDLRIQLETRKKTLVAEITNLDQVILELEQAELAMTNIAAIRTEATETQETPQVSSEFGPAYDPWWVSTLKVIAIYLLLAISLGVSVFALVIDLIRGFGDAGLDFSMLRGLWDFSWNKLTLEWYWDNASTHGAAISILLIVVMLGFGGIADSDS